MREQVVAVGSGAKDLAMLDLLLPPHRRLVGVCNVHDTGSQSLTVGRNYGIVVGGHEGSVSLVDVRTWRPIHQVAHAHSHGIRSMCGLLGSRFVATGGSDGNVALWDAANLVRLFTWENVHPRATVLSSSTAPTGKYGVTQVMCDGDHLWSCGVDGRVLRRRIVSFDAAAQ